MNDLISYGTTLTAIIGVLAFIVSVITQVIKEMPLIADIPTSLLVITLSISMTPAAYIAYAQYSYMQIHWYMIAASIIAGFFVAFVAMFGWEKISDIYSRMIKSK